MATNDSEIALGAISWGFNNMIQKFTDDSKALTLRESELKQRELELKRRELALEASLRANSIIDEEEHPRKRRRITHNQLQNSILEYLYPGNKNIPEIAKLFESNFGRDSPAEVKKYVMKSNFIRNEKRFGYSFAIYLKYHRFSRNYSWIEFVEDYLIRLHYSVCINCIESGRLVQKCYINKCTKPNCNYCHVH